MQAPQGQGQEEEGDEQQQEEGVADSSPGPHGDQEQDHVLERGLVGRKLARPEEEEQEQESVRKIEYSEKYCDGVYEYRQVILPEKPASHQHSNVLLREEEWRAMGVMQSRGWVHYAFHRPEPHILLFRRPIGTDPNTGEVDPTLKRKAKELYISSYEDGDDCGS
jgi:cyclin-dependent kinase regulatory subunit CKS1